MSRMSAGFHTVIDTVGHALEENAPADLRIPDSRTTRWSGGLPPGDPYRGVIGLEFEPVRRWL